MNSFVTTDQFNSIERKIKKKENFNVNAVFIGTNNSLEYKTGKKYNLKVGYHNEHISIEGNNAKFCLYSSIESLLKNWNIKTIE